MRLNPLSLPSAWGLGSQVEKREADLGVRSQDVSRERAHVEEQQARRALLDEDTLAVVAAEYRPRTRTTLLRCTTRTLHEAALRKGGSLGSRTWHCVS
jgi:hypothetical protein